MAYNPELVEQLLGTQVAELMDGTIEIIPAKDKFLGNLEVGDILVFNLKSEPDSQPKQFIITIEK